MILRPTHGYHAASVSRSSRWLITACLAVIPAFLPMTGGHQNSPALQGKGKVSAATYTHTHQDCPACHAMHGGAVLPLAAPIAGPQPKARRSQGSLLGVNADVTCMGCHSGLNLASASGGVARFSSSLGAGSRHMMGLGENPGVPYQRVIRGRGRRIVLKQDCSGCHDPHEKGADKLRTTAFDQNGNLLVGRPLYVAQICFGCHAGPEATSTAEADPDVGLLFSKGSASSHFIGRLATDRPDLPSLRGTEFKGRMDCTSCHDNPDPGGPKGPHLSQYPFLLKANYGRERDASSLGSRANELCYTCHQKSSIEANQSFPSHREHLLGFTGSKGAGSGRTLADKSDSLGASSLPRMGTVREARPGRGGSFMTGFGEPTPCSTCHDPHGSRKNASLIHFDRSIVTPSSVGGMEFTKNGLGHGTCTLTCHGSDHVQIRY